MGFFCFTFFLTQALVLEILLTVTEKEGGAGNQSDYFIAGMFYEDMYFS